MQWFYAADNEQKGPLSQEAFDQLVADGTITPETLVWHEDLDDWIPLGQLTQGDAAATLDDGTGQCMECGRTFPQDELVTFGSRRVCAACKPTHAQRVREGAPAPAPRFSTGAQLPPRTNGYAIAGMVVAILSINGVFCYCVPGIVMAVVSLLLSLAGLRQAREDPHQSGRGMAVAGVWISAVVLGLAVLGILLVVVMIALDSANF